MFDDRGARPDSSVPEPTVGADVPAWLAASAAGHVAAVSDPEPTWEAHNVVVAVSDPRVARHVIRDWERIEAPDRRIAFIVLGAGARPTGRGPDGPGADADDRSIARHALFHAVRAGIPGMLVGAVVFAVAAGLLAGSAVAVLIGALGGAMFGGPIAGVWGFVAASGWSSAYRESFVRRKRGATYVATFHSPEVADVEFAELRAAEHTQGGIQVIEAAPPAG